MFHIVERIQTESIAELSDGQPGCRGLGRFDATRRQGCHGHPGLRRFYPAYLRGPQTRGLDERTRGVHEQSSFAKIIVSQDGDARLSSEGVATNDDDGCEFAYAKLTKPLKASARKWGQKGGLKRPQTLHIRATLGRAK